jgi:hypothetical protein
VGNIAGGDRVLVTAAFTISGTTYAVELRVQ